VISPRIPKNLIDHRVYDHACVPKLLESLFGLNALTDRDRSATDLSALINLTMPRGDTPATLPGPADSAQPLPALSMPSPDVSTVTVSRPGDTVNQGNLPAVVHSAMQQDLSASPQDRARIVSRVQAIRTRAQAASYMHDVQKRVRPMRALRAGRT
jgi:phospholipase C